jgi:GNAT superfamily N-acetyltransferase
VKGFRDAGGIRPCRDDEVGEIHAIINAAAQKYRGVIPDDCWHEPYMSREQLDREIAAGVQFWGLTSDDKLVAVMGIQHVRDVDLIRHAYTRPEFQGKGAGGQLLRHFRKSSTRPMLIGTWADATWAIGFYERHGFEVVPKTETPALLRKYWTIGQRQIETSVVLREKTAGNAERTASDSRAH